MTTTRLTAEEIKEKRERLKEDLAEEIDWDCTIKTKDYPLALDALEAAYREIDEKDAEIDRLHKINLDMQREKDSEIELLKKRGLPPLP